MSKHHSGKFQTRKYRKLHPGESRQTRLDPNALEPKMESKPISAKNIPKQVARIKSGKDLPLPSGQNDLVSLAIKKDLIRMLILCFGLIIILVGLWLVKIYTTIFETFTIIIFRFLH